MAKTNLLSDYRFLHTAYRSWLIITLRQLTLRMLVRKLLSRNASSAAAAPPTCEHINAQRVGQHRSRVSSAAAGRVQSLLIFHWRKATKQA